MPAHIIDTIERKSYECFDKPLQHQAGPVDCELISGKKRLLALGDSHMYASLPGLEAFAKQADLGLSYVGYSGCPPLISVYPVRKDQVKKNCHALNKKTMALAEVGSIDGIYLASRWTYFTEGNYEGKKNKFLYIDESDKKNKSNSKAALFKGIEDTFAKYGEIGAQVYVLLQVPLQELDADEIYFQSFNRSGEIDQTLVKPEFHQHRKTQLIPAAS